MQNTQKNERNTPSAATSVPAEITQALNEFLRITMENLDSLALQRDASVDKRADSLIDAL